MRHEELRKLLRAQPFQPFTIHLPEGRKVPIVHYDFAVLSPDGRTLLAYEPDSSFNMIDVMLIGSIEVGPPPSSPPPKASDVNGPSVA
jgi:hypothetical protein